jgi:CO/xanthine dehydrogenase Mo-binding subunit
MGISHALHEEMTFDESNVTSSNWRSYPILTIVCGAHVDTVSACPNEF